MRNGTGRGALFALIAALCSATSNVQIRFLNGVEKPGAIVFYFSLMTMLIGLFYRAVWLAHAFTAAVAAADRLRIFGGMAQILVTLSLRYTDASLLAPFDYTTLVWSMMIGYLFLNVSPARQRRAQIMRFSL